MFQIQSAKLLVACSAFAAMSAFAQPSASHHAAPVVQPQAIAQAYRSALDGYQPYTDDKVVPWKEANDTVGKIGGWRSYAKEAAAPATPAANNPHASHGKH